MKCEKVQARKIYSTTVCSLKLRRRIWVFNNILLCVRVIIKVNRLKYTCTALRQFPHCAHAARAGLYRVPRRAFPMLHARIALCFARRRLPSVLAHTACTQYALFSITRDVPRMLTTIARMQRVLLRTAFTVCTCSLALREHNALCFATRAPRRGCSLASRAVPHHMRRTENAR